MADLRDLKPMLLDERPLDLSEPGWVYELKMDGWRLMAKFGGGYAELRTRNGADSTTWFPEISQSLASVKGGPYITDGEVCVLDDLGRPDFDQLQGRARKRQWYKGADLVTYCVFDLLMENGVNITQHQLVQRKVLLAELFKKPMSTILPLGHFDMDGKQLFEQAVMHLKLEGLVAKRADSIYRPGIRSADWVKVKPKGAVPPERFKRAAR